jgi:hypothetical protein
MLVNQAILPLLFAQDRPDLIPDPVHQDEAGQQVPACRLPIAALCDHLARRIDPDRGQSEELVQ